MNSSYEVTQKMVFPLTLLRTAQNHPMLIELKNGETYNGHLEACDCWMNVHLRDVICTSKEGDRFWRIPEAFIRGCSIKYLRIPEEVMDCVRDEIKETRKHQRENAKRKSLIKNMMAEGPVDKIAFLLSMNFLEKRMSQLETLIRTQSEVSENFEESILSQYKTTKLALNEFLQNKSKVIEYLQECKEACDIIQPRFFIEILLSPNAKLQLIMLKMDSLKALIAMFAKVSSFSPVLNSESIRVVNSYPSELTRTSENFLTAIAEKECIQRKAMWNAMLTKLETGNDEVKQYKLDLRFHFQRTLNIFHFDSPCPLRRSISIPLGFLKRKDRYSGNPSIEIFVRLFAAIVSNESNELSGHLSNIA
ncbi:U6 snRNA-associated Sm-like protein LSm4 [Trichinella spiralis]|uniref:U6 snRNA-associated Sm-like protein LSm4 n=1 Tax=Trichinella spiralis TaxID=6334 RepID=A0A0V1AXE8_TRISP|nr:U6 snRNA-associated Sm-like protein LSm4 [Trichinella spiralis]